VKREDIGHAAVAYMAEMMDLHESDRDQGQNQLARHLAQFGARCFTEGLKRAEEICRELAVKRGPLTAYAITADAIASERAAGGER